MAQYYITFYIKQDKSLTGNCLNCLHFSFLLLTSAARIKGFISHTVKFIVRFKFLLSMSKDLKMPLCLYPYHLIITSYFSLTEASKYFLNTNTFLVSCISFPVDSLLPFYKLRNFMHQGFEEH